jgi:hypothetical protein
LHHGMSAQLGACRLGADLTLFDKFRRFSLCPDTCRKRLLAWLRSQLLGASDGSTGELKPGDRPPYAGLCWPEFNVHYKFVFVRGVKTGGSSIELALKQPGAKCRPALVHKPEVCSNCAKRHPAGRRPVAGTRRPAAVFHPQAYMCKRLPCQVWACPTHVGSFVRQCR